MNKEEKINKNIEECSFCFPYSLKNVVNEIVPDILKSLENTQFEDNIEFIEFLLQEFKKKQSQLDIANKKLDKIEKYIKENACYSEKEKECLCSFSSMALDKILEIIGGE